MRSCDDHQSPIRKFFFLLSLFLSLVGKFPSLKFGWDGLGMCSNSLQSDINLASPNLMLVSLFQLEKEKPRLFPRSLPDPSAFPPCDISLSPSLSLSLLGRKGNNEYPVTKQENKRMSTKQIKKNIANYFRLTHISIVRQGSFARRKPMQRFLCSS